MFFTTLLVLGLRTLLVYKNRQFDKQYGTVEVQRTRIAEAAREAREKGSGEEEVSVAVENYGPQFRYVL